MSDGTNGIEGLDKYLRNIKVCQCQNKITNNVTHLYPQKAHAPECPVMIIGTHYDAVNVKEKDISQYIHNIYSDNHSFPKIADVCCVSNTRSNMEVLRNRIYSVAMRLCYQWNQC